MKRMSALSVAIADANLVPFNRGTTFPGIYASGGDGFRFNDFSQITSNLTRDTFNGFLSFDASPALKFFASGEYYHSRADQLVTQPSPTDGFPGSIVARDVSIYYLTRGGLITDAGGVAGVTQRYQFDPSGKASYIETFSPAGVSSSG